MSFGLRRRLAIDSFDRKVIARAGWADGELFLTSHDAPPVFPDELTEAIAELEASVPPEDDLSDSWELDDESPDGDGSQPAAAEGAVAGALFAGPSRSSSHTPI
jgi:hypothetical protein